MEETTTPQAGATPKTPATPPPVPPTPQTPPATPPAPQGETPQTPLPPQPSEGESKKWLIIVGTVIVAAGILYILLR